MKSKVYFMPLESSDKISIISDRLKVLIAKSNVLGSIRKDEKVAVKIHFGEEGNTGFVRPEYVRVVCDAIVAKKAAPFLTDTNTLYRGRRTNSKDHLKIAREHGFTERTTGSKLVIPDDNKKEDLIDIKIDQKFIAFAKLARFFIDADVIIAINHFKGHALTGFGGALKNIGMGCATRAGKLAQHCDISPIVYKDKCIGCGACEKICPTGAISIEEKKSVIDKSKCIGCASCIEACPVEAMFIDLESGGAVQMKMVEYAAAVLKAKEKKTGFLNFAIRINKECDCWGPDNPQIAPDVGVLASNDPVSIDKASFDLVKEACGKDVFKEAHPDQDGIIQLEYARELGLGSLDYDLVKL